MENQQMFEKLSPIQAKIAESLAQMKEKSLITEANLAKKVRAICKIEGKNKAGIALTDLEKALECLSENGIAFYAMSMNSVNEFLLKKSEEFQKLNQDAQKRRLTSEKSKTILTDSDLNEKKTSKKSRDIKEKNRFRTKTEKINIYSDFEELDD